MALCLPHQNLCTRTRTVRPSKNWSNLKAPAACSQRQRILIYWSFHGFLEQEFDDCGGFGQGYPWLAHVSSAEPRVRMLIQKHLEENPMPTLGEVIRVWSWLKIWGVHTVHTTINSEISQGILRHTVKWWQRQRPLLEVYFIKLAEMIVQELRSHKEFCCAYMSDMSDMTQICQVFSKIYSQIFSWDSGQIYSFSWAGSQVPVRSALVNSLLSGSVDTSLWYIFERAGTKTKKLSHIIVGFPWFPMVLY